MKRYLRNSLIKIQYLFKSGPGQAPGLLSQYPVRREGIRPNALVFLLVAIWNQFSIHIQNVSVTLSDMYFLHNRTESGTSNL